MNCGGWTYYSDPGPYTVKLNSGNRTDDSHPLGLPLTATKVIVADDAGNAEELQQVNNGSIRQRPPEYGVCLVGLIISGLKWVMVLF